ncbi:MAG: MMPL family transporter [Verrucomicrobiales bacterium]
MRSGRWWLWGGFLVGLAAYVCFGLSRITLDVDITRLLPPRMKETVGYQLFLKNFSHPNELLMTLEGADAEALESAAAAIDKQLGAGKLARRVVWQLSTDQQSPALIELTAWALINQTPERLAELEKQLAPERIKATLEANIERLATSLDASEGMLGYDPLGLTSPLLASARDLGDLAPDFVSKDGTFRLLYVESAFPLRNYRVATDWIGQVRTAAEAVAAPNGVSVHFTGEPAFFSEISESMERDMRNSGFGTLLLASLIVWWGFRSYRPLPPFLATLILVFVLTLATAGFLLGSLTVLTVGCASILIGLSADFGVLMYHASIAGGDTSPSSLARTRRGITWAAATTSASFAALIPSGMPGLAELGLIVSMGVALGAVAFMFLFPRWLALLAPERTRGPDAAARWSEFARSLPTHHCAFVVGLLVVVALSGLLVSGPPRINPEAGTLRPRSSEAYSTLDRVQQALGGSSELLSVLVAGASETEVAHRLDSLQEALERAKAAGNVRSFALPRLLWPNPGNQKTNLEGAALRLAAEASRLEQAVREAGFTDDAFALAKSIFEHWKSWVGLDRVHLQGEQARWLLSRFMVAGAHSESTQSRPPFVCLGMIQPSSAETIAALETLQTDGVYLAGARLLNRVLERFLSAGFVWLAVIFGGITFAILAFALHGWRPLLLTLVALIFAFSGLAGAMSWLGLSWNAFTLPALLLSLGTGSDYFIYVIFELERHQSSALMRANLLRPILMCGGISTLGFGSLAFASNLGLSSLGAVCALALTFNILVALFVLPWLWEKWNSA